MSSVLTKRNRPKLGKIDAAFDFFQVLLIIVLPSLKLINNTLLIIFIYGLSLLFLLLTKKTIKAFCVYIICSPWIVNSYILVGSLLAIMFCWFVFNNVKFSMNKVIYLIIVIALAMISFVVGIRSEIATLFQAICCCLVFMIIYSSSLDEEECDMIVKAFVVFGYTVLLYTLINVLTGSNVLLYRRLAFNSNIRSMANACVVPLFFLTQSILGGRKVFKCKVLNVVSFVLFSFALLLTVSRGAFYSFATCIALSLFLINKRKKIIRALAATLTILLVFLLLFYSNYDINLSRTFVDETGGLNGRLEIWRFYFSLMKNNGTANILFGLGPGNLAKLSTQDYYSHSVFLDIVFCYGFVGFGFVIFGLLGVLMRMIKKKNYSGIILFVSVVVNYLTHSTAINYLVYILLSFSYVLVEKNVDTKNGETISEN